MKNKYVFSAIGCYINYFVFGMAYIMIAQNMSFLTKQFDTDNAGISFLISAFGFGRLFSLYFNGVLSDRIGRKPFVLLGGLFMAIFLIGIPLSPNYQIAIIFAVCGGLANAFLDAGTYPTLMEAFPKTAGSATVIIKAFISFGTTLLPLIISFFISKEIFYGWAFFLPAIIFILNAIILFKAQFPHHKTKEQIEDNSPDVTFISKPKFWQEGLALILIGFTAPALLYIMQIWLPTYGQEVIGMSLVGSLQLLSYYSIGSVISVVGLAVIVRKRVKPVTIILVYPIISFIATIALITIKTPIIAVITSFIIGVTLAGILQLGLTVLCEFFWDKKGTLTGIMYTATGAAAAGIPLVTGYITRFTDINGVFIFALFVNGLGILLAAFLNYRYKVLTCYKGEKLVHRSNP